ncbi:MAG TPA: hypothetical protein VMR39_07180 [Sphingobium sp.]|nr:hypothetical protein [Sphingobium sp.]HUD91352.1 hypothetical protein [Sphingobium sp.]
MFAIPGYASGWGYEPGQAMKARTGAWLGAIASLGTTTSVAAQQPLRLDTQMFVERTTTDLNGRPRRVLASANRLQPGDQLIVLLNWRNDGSTPLRDAAVTRALPRGQELDLDDPSMQISVDGGAHWGRLYQFLLPTPLGGTRRAVASDVTHVRWTLPPAAAGQTGRISYRATIR